MLNTFEHIKDIQSRFFSGHKPFKYLKDFRFFAELCLLFYLLLPVCSTAQQNLVPNPSFELNTGCPQGYDELYLCNDWYKPTQGSSDYFHACAPTSVVTIGVANVPVNSSGYQYAFDGDAYVGGAMYWVIGGDTNVLNDYNEFIQCKLLQPLEAGKQYHIRFFVNLGDSTSNHAIKSIGAWFSDTAYIDMSSYGTIPATPQVVANYFLSDIDNWMEISGSFTAKGGEKYLTIGSFINPVLNTDTLFVQDTWLYDPNAYYYVDMVSVSEVIEPPCSDSLSLPNVFTPNNDGINDAFIVSLNCKHKRTLHLTVLNRWGKVVFETTGTDTVSWDGGTHTAGVYYFLISYTNSEGEEITKKGLVHLLR